MKRMLAILTLCWFGFALAGSPGAIEPADLAALLAAKNAPALLDVRAPSEFASGHLAGAVNIAHNELEARLAELPFDKSQEVVVYCRSGGRAKLAADVLLKAGFTDVRLLTGHILQWQADNRPLVTEPATNRP